jgi:hypothetical protein
MQAVDLCADAPDDFVTALGKPQRRFTVLEKRVRLGIDKLPHFSAQRRDPVRIVTVDSMRQIEKPSDVGSAVQLDDPNVSVYAVVHLVISTATELRMRSASDGGSSESKRVAT